MAKVFQLICISFGYSGHFVLHILVEFIKYAASLMMNHSKYSQLNTLHSLIEFVKWMNNSCCLFVYVVFHTFA